MQPGARTSNDEITAILEAVPGLAWSIGSDGSLEAANQAWIEYTGIPADSAPDWEWTRAVHPDDATRLLDYWRSAELQEIQTRLRGREGEYAPFRIRRRAVAGESGLPVRWYGTACLVPSHVEAEMGAMLNTIPSLAWSTGVDGGGEFLNQRWLDYTGLSMEQARGFGWSVAVHPDDLGGLVAHWQANIAAGIPGEHEARLRRFDGVYRWFLFRAAPAFDASGRIVKWYGTNTDIEDRKSAEEELRRSAESYRVVVETAADAVISFDQDGVIQLANPATGKIFGYDPGQLVGKPLTMLLPQSESQLPGTRFDRDLVAGERPVEWQGIEVTALRAGGVEFPAELSLGGNTSEGRKTFTAFIRDITEKKQSEKALKASESKFRLIVDTTPALVCTLSARWEVEDANQQLLGYFGKTVEELKEWAFIGVVHPDDLEGVVAQCRHSLETGAPYDVEHRCRRHDGEFRWFHVRGLPLKDSEGHVVRWYILLIDIEDRKRAEEVLRARERALRTIIDAIPTLAWSASAEGSAEFFNQRWLDFTGLTAEQALGSGWTVAIHPGDAVGLFEVWRRALAAGTPVDAEARMRRFDGSYRWFLFRANPLRDDAGNIVRWCGTNSDIEDRNQADERLRENERNLRAIINTIPTLSWSTRPDGYVEFLSERWLGFTGLTEEQALGFGWAVAVHPGDAQRLLEYWQSALASGTEVDVEARLRRHDGVYRWFLFRASPLRGESGEILKWYGTNVEIEDRKQADEAVRASERNLRAIINTIPTLSWSTRPDGYVEFLSERWLGFTGLTEEQALGFGWAVAVHPGDAQRLLEYWQSALASGTDVDVEARLRRHDGVYRWFLFRASPLRSESGEILKWYGTNVEIEDRKQADEALRASERNLRSIIDSIPELAWSTSPDGYCDFVNQRWLDFTGCSLEQVLGWGWRPFIHPDDEAGLVNFWQNAIQSGHAGEFEARLRRFDGTFRWFLFRPVPLRDESGNVVKWYGQNIDIDDRKTAEDAVNRNERTLRAVINTIPVTAWSTRPDGYCNFLSQRWLDYAGMSADEAQGWGWGTVIHPDDRAELVQYWQSCLESCTPVDTEARMRRFDGTYRWFLFRANPLRDESGKVISWYGTNIDIEDRKRATEALRASERDLSLIIETIPGFVWCAAPDGEFDYLNQRILDYTGAVLADWAEGRWTGFLHPNDVEPTRQAWTHAVATGQPHQIQCRIRRSDGQYRWFQMLGESARGRHGTARWYGLLLEIDDRVKIEETLRSTEARLSRATQIAAVGEMSASIAHEINQPLAAVVASGHACRRFLKAEPPNIAGAREAAESIVRDGKDAADVVRRVRALFKRTALETTLLNVNDVIGEVLRLLAAEIAKRQVLVETDLAKDLPPVSGDRVQLQQLHFNLFLNGMEAMDSIHDRPRKLSISSLLTDTGQVLVQVRDTGIGFENSDRAFEAFVTTKESGIGMGLTICRSIIEAHHGRLWVAPPSGPGATLCFTLPANGEPA